MRFDWLDWTIAGAVVLVVLGIVALMVLVGMEGSVAQRCLEHGYPESKSIGPTYCIRRVNNSDEVIRLDVLDARKLER